MQAWMWRLTDEYAVIYTNDRATLKALFAYSRFPHHDLSRATTYEGKNGRVFAWQFTFPVSAWNGVVRYLGRASITMLDQERPGAAPVSTPSASVSAVEPTRRKGRKESPAPVTALQLQPATAAESTNRRPRAKAGKPTADLTQPLQPMAGTAAGPNASKARAKTPRALQADPVVVGATAPTMSTGKKPTAAPAPKPVEVATTPANTEKRGKSPTSGATATAAEPARVEVTTGSRDERPPRGRKRDPARASESPSPSPIPAPVSVAAPKAASPRKRSEHTTPPLVNSPELISATKATEDKPRRQKRDQEAEPPVTSKSRPAATGSPAEPLAVTLASAPVTPARKRRSTGPEDPGAPPTRTGARKRSSGKEDGRGVTSDVVPEPAAAPALQATLPELLPAPISRGRGKVRAASGVESVPEVIPMAPIPARAPRGRKAAAMPAAPVVAPGGGKVPPVKPPRVTAKVGAVQEPAAATASSKRAAKR